MGGGYVERLYHKTKSFDPCKKAKQGAPNTEQPDTSISMDLV